MTITYIFQILEAVVKGDAEKYGVIPDMNGELQKAVRRSRRRVAAAYRQYRCKSV